MHLKQLVTDVMLRLQYKCGVESGMPHLLLLIDITEAAPDSLLIARHTGHTPFIQTTSHSGHASFTVN